MMKVREGGMPAEEMWKSFFDSELILKKLSLGADCKTVVDFGCGYGTFAIPAARMIEGLYMHLTLKTLIPGGSSRSASASR
jgi:hypothetical protein